MFEVFPRLEVESALRSSALTIEEFESCCVDCPRQWKGGRDEVVEEKGMKSDLRKPPRYPQDLSKRRVPLGIGQTKPLIGGRRARASRMEIAPLQRLKTVECRHCAFSGGCGGLLRLGNETTGSRKRKRALNRGTATSGEGVIAGIGDSDGLPPQKRRKWADAGKSCVECEAEKAVAKENITAPR
ncbi:hypothetical protein K438DRAFT_1779399 [Mycena galopus ATCC 62051]|nr:hypothetical protein K438DRAFT_1779399 [Mycena galopus ATCC 62051]